MFTTKTKMTFGTKNQKMATKESLVMILVAIEIAAESLVAKSFRGDQTSSHKKFSSRHQTQSGRGQNS